MFYRNIANPYARSDLCVRIKTGKSWFQSFIQLFTNWERLAFQNKQTRNLSVMDIYTVISWKLPSVFLRFIPETLFVSPKVEQCFTPIPYLLPCLRFHFPYITELFVSWKKMKIQNFISVSIAANNDAYIINYVKDEDNYGTFGVYSIGQTTFVGRLFNWCARYVRFNVYIEDLLVSWGTDIPLAKRLRTKNGIKNIFVWVRECSNLQEVSVLIWGFHFVYEGKLFRSM